MWCERIPDFFIQRTGGVMIRLAFNVLETIPAEYATTARIQVDRLVNMVLTKGYGALDEELWCGGESSGAVDGNTMNGENAVDENTMNGGNAVDGNTMNRENAVDGNTTNEANTTTSGNTATSNNPVNEHNTTNDNPTNQHTTHRPHEPFPPFPSLIRRIHHIDIDEDMFLDESFTSFYQREVARRDARLQDILGVIVDKLLLFYGPASQLAASLVDRIASFPKGDAVVTMLRTTLQKHKEFEQCAKLAAQQQMR